MDTVINDQVYPELSLQKTGGGYHLVMYLSVYGHFYSESCQAIRAPAILWLLFLDITKVPTFTFLLEWWDAISLLNPHRWKTFLHHSLWFKTQTLHYWVKYVCVFNPDCPLKHFCFQNCMGHISCSCHLKVIQQLGNDLLCVDETQRPLTKCQYFNEPGATAIVSAYYFPYHTIWLSLLQLLYVSHPNLHAASCSTMHAW